MSIYVRVAVADITRSELNSLNIQFGLRALGSGAYGADATEFTNLPGVTFLTAKFENSKQDAAQNFAEIKNLVAGGSNAAVLCCN